MLKHPGQQPGAVVTYRVFHRILYGNFFRLNLNPETIQLPRRRRCHGTEPQAHITQGQLAEAHRVQVRGKRKTTVPSKSREKLLGRGVKEEQWAFDKIHQRERISLALLLAKPLQFLKTLSFVRKFPICRKVAKNIQRTPKNILIAQNHQWLTFCIFTLSLSSSPPPLSIISFPI